MSTSPVSSRNKVTIPSLRVKKERGEPIVMLTGYDYPTARALDRAGIDAILVGDSLGMVVLGYENTLPVTMEDMIHHCKAVARGARTAHLVGDLPFLSYQVSPTEGVRNAGRLLKEAHVDAVKLEGGRNVARTVQAIVEAGMPVMGHIGLTPQSVHQLGGWRIQGRTREAALRLIEDARILEDSGCYAVVLERIPDRIAKLITARLSIPTLGIGSGSGCDGQVLVTHDLLGMFDRFTPPFACRYAEFGLEMERSFDRFCEEVRHRRFPAAEHGCQIDEKEFQGVIEDLSTKENHRIPTRADAS